MLSLIKFRPFATHSRRYRPKVVNALANDATWWYDTPLWSSIVPSTNNDSWNRSMNVVENEKVWKLSYDLPGIKAKDLSVTLDGSNVQISAARHFASTNGDSKTVKKSRIFQSFPVNSNNVDLSQLKANLSDGVLVITAPKKAESTVNQITITTEPHPEDEVLDDADNEHDDKLEDEFEQVKINDGSEAAEQKAA